MHYYNVINEIILLNRKNNIDFKYLNNQYFKRNIKNAQRLCLN